MRGLCYYCGIPRREASLLPISLTLRNFLSYRDAAPTLHLEDVHVACLCGSNGNGKSALLDAITWALWGKARGQRIEQLLHHGQDDMRVELVFDAGGGRYRVTRRYSVSRSAPKSSLELAVSAGDGEFTAITGNSIRDTEAQIVRLVNMDYDTFVNSAFLMQGDADRFSTATASNRKDVLVRVLGLGLYDRLEERAKQHARDLKSVLGGKSELLEQRRNVAAQASEAEADLGEADRKLEAANAVVGGLSERLERLMERVVELERRKAEGDDLAERRLRVAAQRKQAESEADDLDLRVAKGREIVERAEEIGAGFAALLQARERQRRLASDAQAMVALQSELAPLERAIHATFAGLQRDANAQRTRIESELSPRADSLPSINDRLSRIEQRAAVLGEEADAAARAAEERQRLALDARSLREDNERIQQEGNDKNAKLAMLGHGHPQGAKCPLCESELGEEGVERIRASYEREIDELRARYRTQKQRADALEKQAHDAEQAASGAQSAVDRERSRLDAERARLEVQREEAKRAEGEIESATAELRDMESRIVSGNYARDEQAAALGVRGRIDALGYDADAAEEAEREAKSLSHWEAERQELAVAQARLGDDVIALEQARIRAAEAAAERGRIEAELTAIDRELVDMASYVAQRDEVAREREAAGRDRDALQVHRGSLQQRMEEIKRAAEEAAAIELEVKAVTSEASAYAELALAFGKGGVQALLIEAAIPRLEDEANELLGRMSNGRMSLKIETQKTGKAGEAIETLNVLIADELGTRAYELFSGGERFRVDFALRIALSRLLAWRAGAALPTLFIDEGFGTQDTEGRERILDVIKAIEDRFERILVITHMDDIKEAFPVRIEVSRGSSGSTFAVV